MKSFREDLLDVFFVSKDGTFGFEVIAADAGDALTIVAFERPVDQRQEDQRIERASAQCIQSAGATYVAPTTPGSTHGPSRLGFLRVSPESDYASSVYVMFGGPPAPNMDTELAWHAIRPEVPIYAIAAFPFYKGSYMDLLTQDDWGESYDSPAYWYSPHRVYGPAT